MLKTVRIYEVTELTVVDNATRHYYKAIVVTVTTTVKDSLELFKTEETPHQTVAVAVIETVNYSVTDLNRHLNLTDVELTQVTELVWYEPNF